MPLSPKSYTYYIVLSIILFPACTFIPIFALAQDITLTTEGTSGDIDAKRRGPVLTVESRSASDTKQVTLLADAYVPNTEFTSYPIRFDFYVDRHLFVSQIRSLEQPGPIGVTIGPDKAVPPFGYTVVATVLHPNRQFTTVLNGSVLPPTEAATLDCNITIESSSEDDSSSEILLGSDVEVLSHGDNVYKLEFTATDESGEEAGTISLSLVLDLSTKEDITSSSDITTSTIKGSGSLVITRDDDIETITVSGEVENTSSKLTSISLSSEDELTTFKCS